MEGWRKEKISDVCEINPSKKEISDFDGDKLVSFIPMASVSESGKIISKEDRKLKDVIKGFTFFRNNDVLLAKITPCFENGKKAIAEGLTNGVGFGTTEFHVLRAKKEVLPKWIYYTISREDFRAEAKRKMSGAVGQQRVPSHFLETYEIPVPDVSKQQEVIQEIEKQFTRLDASVKSLEKVKQKLGIYRKCVLKAAFDGTLTKEWRGEYKDKIEPASVLLERIKKDWEKIGKSYNLLPHVELSDTTKLPDSWALARVADICGLINGRAFKPKEWASEGIPIIRIQNLNNRESEFNYCNFEVNNRFYVDTGQLLFAWSGTPGTSFGAHIWKGGKAVLNQHIFKVEINESCLNKVFLMHLLNKNVDGYIQKAHGTAGLAHITKKKFEESVLSIPPFEEQNKIVEEIESRFSVIEKLEETVDGALKKSEMLRKSILKNAFEGKLVP